MALVLSYICLIYIKCNVILNKKLLPILLLLVALFSCKKKDDASAETTWIGGQIVNPKVDYVIFAQGENLLDTVKLDSNNFFLYHTDKMKEGLYILRHNETQVFYINPGDSLLLHVNTLDFDESLAYSGKGGEKNNLLMDLYLKNESENQRLPQWYTLSPKEFTKKIDSLKKIKLTKLDKFIANNKVDEGFKNVANSSINYDYFSKKELYAMANRLRADQLGKDYYSYRKKIDFGKEELRFYYPYYRFLNRYFDNLIVSKHKPGANRNSFDFSLDKLKAIDSTISNDSIKNSLLRFTAMRYLFNAKSAEEELRFYEEFEKANTNPKHLREIKELTTATMKMSQGNPAPNILLLTTDNTIIGLHNVITKPSVLYFWSAKASNQARVIHSRIAELKSKYPEYDFLGLNTDDHYRNWRAHVKNMGYDPAMEYQLENVLESEKTLILSSMNKSIILDKDKTILDGSTNIFNSNFEELLLGYLNR